MGGIGRTNETNADMIVNELAECLKLNLRKRIHCSDGRSSIVFNIDLKIIRSMRREFKGLLLAEDISKVMILWRNAGEIREIIRGRRGSGFGGDVGGSLESECL
jgi:hypothetical protein